MMTKISQTSGFFARMTTAAIVDLQNFRILTVSTVKMTICITVPSLVMSGQTISGREYGDLAILGDRL